MNKLKMLEEELEIEKKCNREAIKFLNQENIQVIRYNSADDREFVKYDLIDILKGYELVGDSNETR